MVTMTAIDRRRFTLGHQAMIQPRRENSAACGCLKTLPSPIAWRVGPRNDGFLAERPSAIHRTRREELGPRVALGCPDDHEFRRSFCPRHKRDAWWLLAVDSSVASHTVHPQRVRKRDASI